MLQGTTADYQLSLNLFNTYFILTTSRLVQKSIHSQVVCPKMNKDRVIMDLWAKDAPWQKQSLPCEVNNLCKDERLSPVGLGEVP